MCNRKQSLDVFYSQLFNKSETFYAIIAGVCPHDTEILAAVTHYYKLTLVSNDQPCQLNSGSNNDTSLDIIYHIIWRCWRGDVVSILLSYSTKHLTCCYWYSELHKLPWVWMEEGCHHNSGQRPLQRGTLDTTVVSEKGEPQMLQSWHDLDFRWLIVSLNSV